MFRNIISKRILKIGKAADIFHIGLGLILAITKNPSQTNHRNRNHLQQVPTEKSNSGKGS